MKLVVMLAAVVMVAVARPDDNHYDTKYDNFNMEELAGNKRLMCAYGHCFIGDGKCTAEGNDIRKWIPEGSENGCAKCTPKQKILVAKFIKGLQVQCPDEWAILNKQMDPDGSHKEELAKFLAENAN